MGAAELKSFVEHCTLEEKLFLQACLLDQQLAADPTHMADMQRRMQDMDDGRKVSWESVLQLHEVMGQAGA